MTTARLPGEFINGKKIAYCFGKVNDSDAGGGRTAVSLGLNGDAQVLLRYRRRELGGAVPTKTVEPSELSAGSASGLCNRHRRDRKKKKASAAHRGRTGVLSGNARLEVVTPKPGTSGY